MPSETFSEIDPQTGQQDTVNPNAIATITSRWFVFEAVVRQDKTVVIHLKNLRPDFRNKKMLDFLTKYFRDRIGAYGRIYADFIGEFGSVHTKDSIKLNSLDIFVYDYVPAKMHDDRFVVRHLSDIGQKLIEEINRQL